MAPTKKAVALLLACAAATARTGAAQGAQKLTYSSYTGGSCPTLTSCLTSGFDYIWDATGDVVFTAIGGSASSPCASYLATTDAGSSTSSGALSLVDADANTYSATYTASTLSVTVTTGCVAVFSRGAAVDAQFYAYSSYTGAAATCAPDACTRAGFNNVADASSTVVFLSASTSTNPGCNGYSATGTATTDSTGTLTFIAVIADNSVAALPAGAVTGTYTATSITVSAPQDNCAWTFTLPSASAAAPPRAAGAVAVLAAGAAAMAALLL